MSNLPAVSDPGEIMESVIIAGDLSKLTPSERVQYYRAVCRSLGLNELTRPFDYIELDGKLTLYAGRGTTDQLRNLKKITILDVIRETDGDLFIVRVRARAENGREDESEGVVPIVKEKGEWKISDRGKRYFQGTGQYELLRGNELANARMRAETKAKRRVTLSIAGLGWMDESERDTLPQAKSIIVDHETGEILDSLPVPHPPSQKSAHNGKSLTAPASPEALEALEAQIHKAQIDPEAFKTFLASIKFLSPRPEDGEIHLHDITAVHLSRILDGWEEAMKLFSAYTQAEGAA